jgi:hypothetical protein
MPQRAPAVRRRFSARAREGAAGSARRTRGLALSKRRAVPLQYDKPPCGASAPTPPCVGAAPARSRYLPVASFGHLLPCSRDSPTETLASTQLAATERALVEALAEG